ncbi:beta-mannosidase [Paenibacillus sp. IHBB 10380]|uniref:beta-mannosidase n=1 Tax=Paenibacillus sp. IHBB 10380 TaxID=1566358 RepID=UPI0005CFADA2|nr:glycoside hydrolase family 2 protein [Paenibacillus sp. IHBB 10380]AJS61217.1 beta-mannosidase [Paenibacillus sp. IHBB 10380]
MKLNDNWKIRDFVVGEARDLEVASPEYIDYYWISANVPGDVHSTLIDRNIIDDPFFGHNDQKCRWVEEKVWWYRTVFHCDDPLQDGERMELVFDGLDTFATIYLNGVELGSTDNMFIRHTFEVTRELRRGNNTLAVKFDPIRERVGHQVQNYWSGFSKKRIWTRKAQNHFGWDWGPRLVCAGIWQDVHLEKRTFAKIDHVFARTVRLDETAAEVQIDVELQTFDKNKNYETQVRLAYGDQEITATAMFEKGKAYMTMRVEDAKLWWTHDLGIPHLYDLHVDVLADGAYIDAHVQKFGIRTVEVLRHDEQGNACFTFVLNGVKIFAKGANWIPIDSFIGSVSDFRYSHLIQMSKDANMNMLRVWGGGVYERDIFYEDCNRQGILVWQDFMFACALYPDYNKNFMDNVRREITEVVKRLRNHPCLAMWCGNNENDWLYEALHSSGEIKDPFYGEKIYHEMMPEILEELDPTRLFWPSSPYGGNDHNSREEGDTHNWQVWHGNIEPRTFGEPQLQDYSVEGLSFKKFKGDTTKFSSEFGMHASSNRYTLERNMPKDMFYWGSEEMAYRNKDKYYPKGILLMKGYTGVPEDIEQYMDFSMLTQAEGLKYGIEHYRRNKPETSGALYWQLNDCWPGTSWSVIDYYGLPKASYHYSRKFFSPILLTLDHDEGEDLKLWALNDLRSAYNDEVELAVYDFNGEKKFSRTYSVSIRANSGEQIDVLPESEAINGLDPAEVVIGIRSMQERTEVNYYFFRDHKDMKYTTAKLTVDIDEGKSELRISTDRFARMVKIELSMAYLVLSDNFFDLLPGETKVIKIHQAQGQAIPWESLRVQAINSK